MYEDDVTDGYTANLHFGDSFFKQFTDSSPEADLLSELAPRSSVINSTSAENMVSGSVENSSNRGICQLYFVNEF